MRPLLALLSAMLLAAGGVAAPPATSAGRAPSPAPGAAAVRYTMDSQDERRVLGVATYSVSCRSVRAQEWLACAAVAPELPGQTNVETTMSPKGVVTRDQSLLTRPVLIAHVPAKTPDLLHNLSIRVTYEATLRSRALRALPPGVVPDPEPALPSADRKRYLAEGGDLDFKADTFVQWLQEKGFLRRPHEQDIDFARRVFLEMKSTFAYTYTAHMDRRASAVCRSGESDCGGLSIAFVAVLRANDIPARVLFGRWAASAQPDERLGGLEYYKWHVKAEFFADGVGWVPVDMAQAVQHAADKTPPESFGVDAGDFITLHVDPNVIVDMGRFGRKTYHSLQSPKWVVGGAGTVRRFQKTEEWQVTPVTPAK